MSILNTLTSNETGANSLTDINNNFSALNTDKIEVSTVTGATSKTTPVDADLFSLFDSVTSFSIKSLTWANIKATLKTYFDALYQPLDSDLTTIAGLTATTDNFMQSKAGAWASRTIAQVKTDLGISNVDNTADTAKPVSTAQQTALNLKQDTSSKDATGGYVGLTLFKINFKNAANTFTNFLTNATTAARTYTFPDKDITVAGIVDIPSSTTSLSEGSNLYFTTARAIASALTGYVSGAGTVASTDTILQAIQKLNGNDGLKANIASPTFTGTVTLPKTNFGSNTAYFTEFDNGNSATADTIDWGVSNKQKSTLTGNCTYTFTAPPGPCSLVLKVVQDATGSRTVTWPATVHWSGGTAPTLTTTASKVDIVTFYYDGTTYFGNSSLNYTA